MVSFNSEDPTYIFYLSKVIATCQHKTKPQLAVEIIQEMEEGNLAPDVEPLHEQMKQFLGVEDSQLQAEKGVRRHLTLVFVVNSLLQSLQMDETVAGLSMEGRREDSQWTFGQRCLRIVLEVFETLIHRIIQWFSKLRFVVTA